ncbi:MAG: thioredoxin family protein [Reichenbachiella sp.]|uniref:thioredoxin family protein n=1 Tax=Reichenbachiella sp. TaxID=2184521 RepID=UPI00326758D1
MLSDKVSSANFRKIAVIINDKMMEVKETIDSDFQEAISSSEKTIIKYYADWCGSCKLFSPKYKRLADDERFSGINFLKVNAENNQEARKAAGVTNLPFFAIFESGKLMETLASSKEEAVVELLNKLN